MDEWTIFFELPTFQTVYVGCQHAESPVSEGSINKKSAHKATYTIMESSLFPRGVFLVVSISHRSWEALREPPQPNATRGQERRP